MEMLNIMLSSTGVAKWHVTGASVVGRTHARKQLANQDAWGSWLSADVSTAILAVADGHGDQRSFRCVEGANLAVRIAIDLLRDCMENSQGQPLSERLIRALPGELVERWRRAVLEHQQTSPLPSAQEGDGDLRPWDPFLPYGSTLLAVATHPQGMLTMQVGDGDILFVSEEAEVTRAMPRDPRLLANETTSLCGPHAEADFQAAFLRSDRPLPPLILAATDGYANSFPDDESFFQVGSDLLGIIRKEGLGAIEHNLASWLSETSHQGSGDDTTVGLLCRLDQSGQQP